MAKYIYAGDWLVFIDYKKNYPKARRKLLQKAARMVMMAGYER